MFNSNKPKHIVVFFSKNWVVHQNNYILLLTSFSTLPTLLPDDVLILYGKYDFE